MTLLACQFYKEQPGEWRPQEAVNVEWIIMEAPLTFPNPSEVESARAELRKRACQHVPKYQTWVLGPIREVKVGAILTP